MNIEKRISKGMGGYNKPNYGPSKNVKFGNHYFKITTTLRESMFVSGVSTNCKVWHNLEPLSPLT